MRGHDQLIQIRAKGLKPAGLVFVDDYPVSDKWTNWLAEKTMVTVCTHGDEIASLDMRFLVGLAVQVSGSNLKRVKGLAGVCKRAGASVVFAVCGDKAAVWKKGDAEWLSF